MGIIEIELQGWGWELHGRDKLAASVIPGMELGVARAG
jgi:hypothetical protein